MGVRYSNYKVVDYCYNPRYMMKDGVEMVVPCCRCNGCLLHKANEWSMRVASEIEHNPYSIFFTLTYSNKYLPTLKRQQVDDKVFWTSSHDDNIRFDTKRDVQRLDSIVVDGRFSNVPIANDSRDDVIPYASKRDIQLYLKSLRRDVEQKFQNYGSEKLIRYYIISEYGPTTYRPHYHAVVFSKSREVSEYLLEFALYQNWQMCDKTLFQQYAQYCDAGTAGYVSNYVTSVASLPKVFKEQSIVPFRLSSKAPSIGYDWMDKEKIFEDVSRGVIEYLTSVPRIDKKYLLRYPKQYLSRLFPKCYRYRHLTDSERIYVYSAFIFDDRRGKEVSGIHFARLSQVMHPMNVQAALAAKRFCDYMSLPCVKYYLYLLDMYYFKSDMFALKMQYQFQVDAGDDYNRMMCVYGDLPLWVMEYRNHSLSRYKEYVLDLFFAGFGLSVDSFPQGLDYKAFARFYDDETKSLYRRDVDSIVDGLQKMPKYNEKVGNAPHIV